MADFWVMLHQRGSPTLLDDLKDVHVHVYIMSFRWDPDFLVGYELQMLSWGYLIQRAAQLNMDLCPQLARIPGTLYMYIYTSCLDPDN